MPEYTDALVLLHGQYVRAGSIKEAIRVAIQALISPPSFGGPPLKALRWLRRKTPPGTELDPIWHSCGFDQAAFIARQIAVSLQVIDGGRDPARRWAAPPG